MQYRFNHVTVPSRPDTPHAFWGDAPQSIAPTPGPVLELDLGRLGQRSFYEILGHDIPGGDWARISGYFRRQCGIPEGHLDLVPIESDRTRKLMGFALVTSAPFAAESLVELSNWLRFEFGASMRKSDRHTFYNHHVYGDRIYDREELEEEPERNPIRGRAQKNPKNRANKLNFK